MDTPLTYCQAIPTMKSPERELHQLYHDTKYGFPLADDNELYERLMLEINQAGLNWTTILKKQDKFRQAFDGFDIQKVARYSDVDVARLMADVGIIRNRKKIEAAIENARVIVGIQKSHGSFANWLERQHPQSVEEWAKAFKKTFHFTGGEIVKEFLTSSGYLKGSHDESCIVYPVVLEKNPPWLRAHQ